MLYLWITIAVMFATTGCARHVWTKPGLTEQEWRVDSYACERDMRQSGYHGTGLAGGLNARGGFYDRCLQSKGLLQGTRRFG